MFQGTAQLSDEINRIFTLLPRKRTICDGRLALQPEQSTVLFPIYKRYFTGPVMSRDSETGKLSPHYNIRLVFLFGIEAETPVEALRAARMLGAIMPIVGSAEAQP